MARSSYRVFTGDTSPYFTTSTIVNWLPLFNQPLNAQFMLDSLRFLQEHKRLILYAYVFMENHIHMVVAAQNLPKEIANFKSFVARQIIDRYRADSNEYILNQLAFHKLPHHSDREYQFWQEGYHPQQIQDEAMMRQKVEYIHHNPVRRGYVDLPEHWRYSSARNYAGQPGLLEVNMNW
jgi:REP element-mobilizing transposase RayT